MNTNDKKAVIINAHLNIKNVDELADYLEKYFSRDNYRRYGLYIDSTDENMMVGTIKGAFFNITYEQGKRAAIMIDQDKPEALNILEKAISPVMWYVDKDSIAPVKYCAPFLRYSTPTSYVVEWETFDPVGKLKSVAFEIYTNKTNCTNIEVCHPTLRLEDFKESTYFGNMDGYVPAEIQDTVDNFSEFELYYNIKQLYNLYNYYERLDAVVDDGETKESVQERLMYNIDYLLRKTEDFGVRAFPPSPQPFNLTKEQMAWFMWWDKAFTKEVEEKPWTLQEWKKFPKGFDPKFKPKGSYKDLLEAEQLEKE